LHKLQ
jgi:hypothetical protein